MAASSAESAEEGGLLAWIILADPTETLGDILEVLKLGLGGGRRGERF